MRTNFAVLTVALTLAGVAGAWASTSRADQAGAADDQPLPEVTVIGKLDPRTLNRQINQFVQSHAQPSTLIGQVGSWRDPVCPVVSGLQDKADKFVSLRISSVARSVGAPAPANGKKCNVNVEVVFTPEPQALLDHIAHKYRGLLGYYRVSETKQNTTFTHPLQAWYVTGSRSLSPPPPTAMPGGPPCNAADCAAIFGSGLKIDSEEGISNGYAGSRLGRELRSEFMHVLIIADSKAVAKYTLQSISDYAALLALTHVAALDSCSELPSIINLFATNCTAPPATITTADTAYLKALYGTALEKNLNIEQGEIHGRMLDAISPK